MFGGIHQKWRGRWERRRLRNRVIKALTLAPRGAVPDDGPRVREMSLALRLEWHARDLHPWDCDLPADRRAELFTAELMAETIVAIRQTFERLAEVDVIEIRGTTRGCAVGVSAHEVLLTEQTSRTVTAAVAASRTALRISPGSAMSLP